MFATIDNHVRAVVSLGLGMLAATCLTSCVDHKVDPGYCGACTDANVSDAMASGDAKVDGAAAGNGGGGGTAGNGASGNGASGSGANDAAVDASDDSSASDAGPCGMSCPTSRPVCDADSHKCVECLDKDDCKTGDKNRCETTQHKCVECLDNTQCKTGDKNVCNPFSHECVECLSKTDCKSIDAAACNVSTHACVACSGDQECTRFNDTPVCDETVGKCRQCTGDTEQDQCNDKSCKRSTGTCTATTRASLNACAKCDADSECATSMKCVEHVFSSGAAAVDLGAFCFYEKTTGCADALPAYRPYSRSVNLTSVDGVTTDYCLPPQSTTCRGIIDATDWNGVAGGAKSCNGNQDCGEPDVQDGTCVEGGPAMGKCSYGCSVATDCPNTGFKNCSAALCLP